MADNPMLQVLVCDDDRRFLEQMQTRIREILDAKQISAVIRAFESVTAVPADSLESCDLAFLDIDFPEEDHSGIDLARMMRAAQHDAIIIFVSNYIEYAPEGYEVQAFRYVLKSEVPQKLEQYVSQAIAKREKIQQTMQICVSGETVTVLLSDILYVESQGHAALLHLQDGKRLRFYASIGKLEQEMESQGFLRVHKGFLVNMAHVQQFKSTGAVLTSGVHIPVSEKNYAEQKKRYLLWKGRQ